MSIANGTDLRIFGSRSEGYPSWNANSALTSNLGGTSALMNHAGIVNNLQSRFLLACGGYQVLHK